MFQCPAVVRISRDSVGLDAYILLSLGTIDMPGSSGVHWGRHGQAYDIS